MNSGDPDAIFMSDLGRWNEELWNAKNSLGCIACSSSQAYGLYYDHEVARVFAEKNSFLGKYRIPTVTSFSKDN